MFDYLNCRIVWKFHASRMLNFKLNFKKIKTFFCEFPFVILVRRIKFGFFYVTEHDNRHSKNHSSLYKSSSDIWEIREHSFVGRMQCKKFQVRYHFNSQFIAFSTYYHYFNPLSLSIHVKAHSLSTVFFWSANCLADD